MVHIFFTSPVYPKGVDPLRDLHPQGEIYGELQVPKKTKKGYCEAVLDVTKNILY